METRHPRTVELAARDREVASRGDLDDCTRRLRASVKLTENPA
jgi:hypothetical protein